MILSNIFAHVLSKSYYGSKCVFLQFVIVSTAFPVTERICLTPDLENSAQAKSVNHWTRCKRQRGSDIFQALKFRVLFILGQGVQGCWPLVLGAPCPPNASRTTPAKSGKVDSREKFLPQGRAHHRAFLFERGH